MTAALSDAELEFGQGAGVSVVLNEDGDGGECPRQVRLQRRVMPAWEVRRIDEKTFFNLQRPADGHAEGDWVATRLVGRRDQVMEISDDFRKDIGEGQMRLGGHFDALQNAAIGSAFNTGRFGTAHVKAEN